MKNKKWLNGIVLVVVIVFVALFSGYQYCSGAFSDSIVSPTKTTETQLKQDTKNQTQKKQTIQKNDETSKSSKENQQNQKPTKATQLDTNGNEDFSTMKRPTVDEVNNAQQNLAQASSQFSGRIEIPKIGLQLNILEGCTYQKMLYGATTLMADEVIGQGNYALASHNMGVERSMFTSIYQLQTGDDIFLTNQVGQRFHYRVTRNNVVDFRDTTCLKEQDHPVVTLVTCQSVQTTPNRVVVQGTLVND